MTQTTASRRAITPEDLYRLEILSGCELSPDGRLVAYAQTRVDRKKEKRYTSLWVVPTDGGEPRRFTCGDWADDRPRWSPDGRTIAFRSNRADEKQHQLYLIPLDGGEARKLTDIQGTIDGFEWSPDGARLVFQLRRKDQDEVERDRDEDKKKLGVVARHITRVFYKYDGKGFLPKERWHLATVDARSGEVCQLTAGAVHDEVSPCWSPDGAHVAYLSNVAKDPDLDPDAMDVFVMPAAGGTPRRVPTPYGSKELLSWSPDGALLAYTGREGKGCWWKNRRLWVVPAAGDAPAQSLTDGLDANIGGWTIGDTGDPDIRAPLWSKDARTLYVQVPMHGSTTLRAVRVDAGSGGGSDAEIVVDGPGRVGAFGIDRAGARLAWFQATMTDPGRLRVRELAAAGAPLGETRTLTAANSALLDEVELTEPEELWIRGPAGNQLQGWILRPRGFDPARRWPTILEIHGGPRVQYGHTFMHEFHVLAARGYVVAFCNPRGGDGYGEEHSRAIWKGWGTVDYEDLMAFADAVCERPYVDRERFGVTGGSYGGYMTAWIIGHTHRFKAAVVQRAVTNMISLYGASDVNWVFEQELAEAPPWEALDQYWSRSPLAHIGNARTPTLITHNEQDLRCCMEQGEQLFVALKRLGVESELVLFPEEPHGLSRTGRTDRRIARLSHIARWFDKHLLGDSPPRSS